MSAARTLDFDLDATAAMLAALRRCPVDKRLDRLATLVKVYVERPDVFDPPFTEGTQP